MFTYVHVCSVNLLSVRGFLMYVVGIASCLVAGVVNLIMGNIPATAGFAMGALGGWCAYDEKKERLELENVIKTLNQ